MREIKTWADGNNLFSITQDNEEKFLTLLNGNVIGRLHYTAASAERFLKRRHKTTEGYLEELESLVESILEIKCNKHYGSGEAFEDTQGRLNNYLSRKAWDKKFQEALDTYGK